MQSLLVRLALWYAILAAIPAMAAWQELPPLRKVVDNYIAARTAELPGKTEVAVGAIDQRLRLPRCENLKAFLPPGTRLWGNSTVGIRCIGPSPWSIYVPVSVKVIAPVVVSTRPLAQGRVLTRDDFALQNQDITRLPAGIISDPAQALGKTITSSIPSGYPLLIEMLRAQTVILRGQTVKVITRGPGFKVSTEGKALANASAGQVVPVRTQSGQVINGIAKPEGVVEIAF